MSEPKAKPGRKNGAAAPSGEGGDARSRRDRDAGSCSTMPRTTISIRGAREHNLKNVDLDLPRDSPGGDDRPLRLGKSSLAFDTIYAEGQRRYVESLSAYARQFLEMMQKPDVDQIDGLSPAISIEQKTTSKNPRSTVGTVTEIYDYMRLLFARIGVPYSPATGLPIESQTVSQMVDRVLSLPEGTRLLLLAPVVRGRKGEYRKELQDFQKKGFQRVKVDGTLYEISEAPALDKKLKHDIEVVVDRIVVRGDLATRLADSFETALGLAEGIAFAEFVDEKDDKGAPKRLVFSEKFACPVSGASPSPRSSRGSSPSTTRSGRAPTCGGLGSEQKIDPELVVPRRLAQPRQGSDRALGQVGFALLRADARGARQALRLRDDDALARPAGGRPQGRPVGNGPRGDRVRLRRRSAPPQDAQDLRGLDPELRTALARDRERMVARGESSAISPPPPAATAAAIG